VAIAVELAANLAAVILIGRPGAEETSARIIGPAGAVLFRYMQFEMHVDALIFLSSIVVGAVILARYPRQGFGWALSVGWGLILTLVHVSMVGAAAAAMNDAVAATTWIMWFQSIFESAALIAIPLALVLYPTGRTIGAWWMRLLNGFIAIGIGILVALGLQSGPITSQAGVTILDNPVGVLPVSANQWFIVFEIAFLAFMVAALIVRYTRGHGIERQQMKWVFAIAGAGTVLLTISGFIQDAYPDTADALGIISGALGAVGILAIGMAIVRHNLFDIDVVISKTVTYGMLAGFITAVYAVIVVGVGSLVGGGDEPNLGLSIAAVAIVAVAFEPVRVRVQHWANVLVYGRRATPYEVLATATARLSDTSDPDEALARVAQLVAEGTGAVEAVVWLKVGNVMYPRASSPPDVVADLAAVAGEDPLAGIAADRVVAVRHRGDVLGALSITKDRADAVTGSDEKVLEDVAAGAGVLVRNMGLNAELAERAEQLRVSRRRLVAAHDAERHRLERDLHDGAQQQVVALKVKLGIARTLAEREGAEQVATMVASLSDTTQQAVDGMRAVAHGIYPPLLEAEGLEPALGAARRTIPIPVEIVTSGLDRYDRTIEESIYFSVLDTVGRAVDVGATRTVASLGGDAQSVSFRIDVDADLADLTAVADRLDALGGGVSISSEPGRSVIDGHLPVATSMMELA
jgi:signal transduction histidine kinase